MRRCDPIGARQGRADRAAGPQPCGRPSWRLTAALCLLSCLGSSGRALGQAAANLDTYRPAPGPDDGFIVDSLAWAYYRLGQYDKAVVYQEKAVSLEPAQPRCCPNCGGSRLVYGELQPGASGPAGSWA